MGFMGGAKGSEHLMSPMTKKRSFVLVVERRGKVACLCKKGKEGTHVVFLCACYHPSAV